MGARLTLHISDFEKNFTPFEHFWGNFKQNGVMGMGIKLKITKTLIILQ
jgi:hypothetical protein